MTYFEQNLCKMAGAHRGQAVKYCLSPMGSTPPAGHFAKAQFEFGRRGFLTAAAGGRKAAERFLAVSLIAAMLVTSAPRTGFAVVGQAEEFDRFEWDNLETFQDSLIEEERMQVFDEDSSMQELLRLESKKLKEKGAEEGSAEYVAEMEEIKRQLLNIPEPDRIGFELNGSWDYDTNQARAVPRQEKGDTNFNLSPTVRFDLSGKKTDLRFDVSGGKFWSIHFPTQDMYLVEERLRFRRNFFKKTSVSANSRLARTETQTIEIDSNKIRWDQQQDLVVNYAFSPKLSLNMETNFIKRYFSQEAFDQDSGWQETFAPSAFWNVTPKSRISLGYNYGISRNRDASGNANSQKISLAYFGKITRKSSASLDLSYSHQDLFKVNSTSNTYTAGVGYIWQATPKSQITIQAIRSLQNSTSELVSGTVDDDSAVSKTDTYFSNDSLTLSLNTRLTSKISINTTINGSHVRTETHSNQDEDAETRSFTFPFSADVTYAIARWVAMTFGYQFNFRTGNEKTDTFRAHTWNATLRLLF